ncbi:MAG: signal recognition particle-docking protein FtsY [Candidatus Neomarinimicrobiota bacterium]|nr:signal recognition particle-docking protein FtsY [Candidatus Neomarinimicrobiota bacterium]
MPFIGNIFQALSKTRKKVANAFDNIIRGSVTSDSLEELEEILFSTDMGYDTVKSIVNVVENNPNDGFLSEVEDHLISILPPIEENYLISNKPLIVMIVGVNGTGKTTTAAKLSRYYKNQGKNILLIAADTYRAAAIDQLKVWANRLEVDLIYNDQSNKPSSVLFDGLKAAKSNHSDFVIVDTAGRLHTDRNLMSELEKMHRLIKTKFSEFELSSLITLDASLGLNSLNQAKEFVKSADIEGAIMTKMDGSAKGGIIFPIYKELELPVRFMGTGEDLDDLTLFDAKEYTQGLLGTKN